MRAVCGSYRAEAVQSFMWKCPVEVGSEIVGRTCRVLAPVCNTEASR